MTLDRRSFSLSALLAPFAALSARAQQPARWPQHPVKFVAIASPGTSLDVTARYLANQLSTRWGRAVTVENKVGANGIIAADFVAKAAPDGYTLLFTGAPHYTNHWIAEAPLPYDTLRDFAPVAKVNNSPLVFVVPASSPYKTMAELIADMKARPNEIKYSSSGTGSTTQLCTVVLNDMTRTVARHIPYKGATGAITDTVSGQVDFSCGGTAPTIPLIKGGRLRALAVTSAKRLSALAEVPTVAEAGVAGYDMTTWLGVLAPASTPAPVVQVLSKELVALAGTEEFLLFCRNQALNVDIADAQALRAEGPQELERWRRIIELARKT
ncbi:Bug family tripartite tricarboxylate transporter substrate binding protein [Pseudorhodoferax soli]|uniref:Tripartite-type tricarboxylate transporter receptor subunit TctC n=1 Tax=Pseudorhodoferax soli TaxID=545864 RepID=A0A368XRH2_9BURK|nr:tripartite tricarboxylate transporter substrate binding protein [Pseudorhodoferax soli]RCW68604.1 tripartite-type tricarboxylate transporter receptor subunit TctC [Pseudorhodoferax soli]